MKKQNLYQSCTFFKLLRFVRNRIKYSKFSLYETNINNRFLVFKFFILYLKEVRKAALLCLQECCLEFLLEATYSLVFQLPLNNIHIIVSSNIDLVKLSAFFF